MFGQQPPPAGYQPYQPGYQPMQAGYYPQPGYQPMQAGYYPQPGYQPQPQHASLFVIQQPQSVGRTAAPGACRHCGIGVPHTEFTWPGILLAIIFFPIGVLCCFMLQETRCTHCHANLS